MLSELTWKNALGQKMYAAQWHVEFPRAVVCLLHGQGEHCRRYDHVAAFFNENGLAVMSFDQQGHGRTEGPRGHVHSPESLLDDISILYDEARKRYPGTPIVCYGHSFGGQQSLLFLIKRRPADVVCAVIASPWIRLSIEPSWGKVVFGKLMRRILPSITVPNGVIVRGISRSPEVVAAYLADPLVHGKVSAEAGIGNMEQANFLNEFAGEMPVPTLLMHGSEDLLTSFQASEDFSKRVKNLEFRAWPGLFHELHNEPEKAEVLQTALDFVRSKI